MIARVYFPRHVSQDATSVVSSLQQVNKFVRYIQAQNTKTLCSCVQGIDNYLGQGQQPSQNALQRLMDKDTAQQWQKDMLSLRQQLQSKFGMQPSTVPQALGSHQQVVRTARDIRNSVATRKQRIQQAILGQLKRARANTKDISAVQGIQLSKGFYL